MSRKQARVDKAQVKRPDGSVDADALQRQQDRVAAAVTDIGERDIVNAVVLRDVDLAVGANEVRHGLGRSPRAVVVAWKGSASLGSVVRDVGNERSPDASVRLVVGDAAPAWQLVGTITVATASYTVAFEGLDGASDGAYRWTIGLSASGDQSVLLLHRNSASEAWRQRNVTLNISGQTLATNTTARIYVHSSASNDERAYIVGEMNADHDTPDVMLTSRAVCASMYTTGEKVHFVYDATAVALTASNTARLVFQGSVGGGQPGPILPGSVFTLYRRAAASSGSALADVIVV